MFDGHCHRNAPQQVSLYEQRAIWPRVLLDEDWCGEFVARDQQPPADPAREQDKAERRAAQAAYLAKREEARKHEHGIAAD
jgi:hypothetical protein